MLNSVGEGRGESTDLQSPAGVVIVLEPICTDIQCQIASVEQMTYSGEVGWQRELCCLKMIYEKLLFHEGCVAKASESE